MKKPKSRLNQEQLSEQEALQYKDFNKLLDSHNALKNAKAKSKIWKFLAGGASVVAVVSVFLIEGKQDKSSTPVATPKTELKQKQVRPFPEIPIAYEKFIIDPTKEAILKSAEGSVIVIPANSLADSMGNPLQGEVELKYREFRDMIDVFLSGIPMEYDSAGSKGHFESAGMFELLAYQKSKSIFIQPEKTVTVKFASQHAGNQYNMYNFDEEQQRWVYMYKDSSKPTNQNTFKQIERITKEITSLKDAIPLKPLLANPKQIKIQIEVKETEFPEIAVYKNVKFQLLTAEKIDPTANNVEWDMVAVSKITEGNYILHFERGKEVKEFSCLPVFEKSDYEVAKKTFEANYTHSLELIKNKERIKEELIKKYNAEKTEQQTSLQVTRMLEKDGAIGMAAAGMITRIFEIKKFGIFNSDCPKNLPQGSLLAAKLIDSLKRPIAFEKVYLVERNKNALYTYYDARHFSYNPKSKNLMWTITSQNKLAIFSYTDFDTLKVAKGEERKLKMQVVSVNFKNEAQIRKYLHIL